MMRKEKAKTDIRLAKRSIPAAIVTDVGLGVANALHHVGLEHAEGLVFFDYAALGGGSLDFTRRNSANSLSGTLITELEWRL